MFQEEVFAKFLDGKSLVECYESVGSCANHWLDVCQNGGEDLEDQDVFDLISENKNMVEALADYGDRKSTSIQTARRLGEFLGDEMVKDKGLNCKFIITKKPLGAPTSERAVPVAIFSAEPAVMKSFLRKWLKDPSLADFDVKKLLDWDYYIGRLKSAIQVRAGRARANSGCSFGSNVCLLAATAHPTHDLFLVFLLLSS